MTQMSWFDPLMSTDSNIPGITRVFGVTQMSWFQRMDTSPESLGFSNPWLTLSTYGDTRERVRLQSETLSVLSGVYAG